MTVQIQSKSGSLSYLSLIDWLAFSFLLSDARSSPGRSWKWSKKTNESDESKKGAYLSARSISPKWRTWFSSMEKYEYVLDLTVLYVEQRSVRKQPMIFEILYEEVRVGTSQ